VESAPPGPYPEPPADLTERLLPLREVVNPAWYRGHQQAHPPRHFNQTSGRFAAPDGQSFGVLYVGEDEFAAFIEAFNQGVGSTPLGLFVSESLLASRCHCLVSATRALRLVDLTSGAALKRLSAATDSRIGDRPHVVSQLWAAAL